MLFNNVRVKGQSCFSFIFTISSLSLGALRGSETLLEAGSLPGSIAAPFAGLGFFLGLSKEISYLFLSFCFRDPSPFAGLVRIPALVFDEDLLFGRRGRCAFHLDVPSDEALLVLVPTNRATATRTSTFKSAGGLTTGGGVLPNTCAVL